MTAAQIANAEKIIRIGKARGMSDRDIQIALTVALAESNLQNYANSNVPESLQIPHENVGQDHKSVGVFQQQVDIWGTAVELMDISRSANLFYDALAKVANRDAMSIAQAAQTVQRSAFSDGSNYAKQETLASKVLNSLKGIDVSASELGDLSSPGNPLAWVQDKGNLQRIGLFVIGGSIIAFALFQIFKGSPTLKLAASVATKGVVKP